MWYHQKMDLEKAVSFIKEGDNFLLTSHVNPDGDGIGSILGMLGLLKQLGKRYHVICQDPPQDKLSFLHRYAEIETYTSAMPGAISFDAAIIIDVPHLDRIGDISKLLKPGARILSIDHHVSSEHFGSVNLIVNTAAASAQIVEAIYRRMGVPIDSDSAEALYVGLCVDTGRFRFNNTSHEVFATAQRLTLAGAKPDIIADKLYYNETLANKRALAKTLESIELYQGGKVATAQLDNEFLSSDLGRNIDTEGFVNQPISIEGVEVAILFREMEKKKLRISLRSRTDAVDVNKIAGRFGGGGHKRASGCRMEASIDEAKKSLLAAIAGEYA